MPCPPLLCLDDPSDGLSPLKVADVFGHIAGIVRLGTAILLVEQDVHNALAVADRGYVFAAGRVAFAGTADAIASDERIRQGYLRHRRAASCATPAHQRRPRGSDGGGWLRSPATARSCPAG